MLSRGVRLGPYEIVRPLGAGGMGEVYEAADRRLDRVVAVKILPAGSASSAKLKLRLEREARAISALNHPHICAVYDVGEVDVDGAATGYLVMEYCKGETLAKRLERGGLPADLALEYGAQLAEAVGRAHRAGIVHCDIKPGNIVVTDAGVKILDFGLARQRLSPMVHAGADTRSIEMPLAGTPQYLAPELLRGGEPDERSDVYSLGLVLFEMLEGEVPRGAAPAFNSGVPDAVVHVVGSCLREDPERRRQSAADLADDLRWASSLLAKKERRAPSRARTFAIVGWGAATVLAAVLVLVLARTRQPPRVVRRLATVAIPAEISVTAGGRLAVAPDGRSVVFVSKAAGPLYVARLDRNAVEALPGTEGGSAPFFSPDGQWLGFWSGGMLKKIPRAGGDAQDICPAVYGIASWSVNDVIVLSARAGLMTVGASGGRPVPLTQADPGELHLFPSFLPDGRHVLYESIRFAKGNESTIEAVDLENGRVVSLVRGGFQPRYSLTGDLLFLRTATAEVRSGTLFSVAFDPVRVRVRGPEKARVPGLQSYPIGSFAFWDVAADGAIVYVPHNPDYNRRELVWFDRSGASTRADPSIRYWEVVNLSPDGTRIAASDFRSVWIRDVSRPQWVKIEAGGVYNSTPVWSPDGKQVVFASNRGGAFALYVAQSDGSGLPSRLTADAPGGMYPTSWSPDGTTILFEGDTPSFRWHSGKADVATGNVSPLPIEGKWIGNPVFSPDGRWIVWEAKEPESRIYAAPFPSLTPRTLVGEGERCTMQIASCIALPRWSRNGREIVYKAGDRIVSVAVDTTSGVLRTEPPRPLFVSDYEVEVSRDGERFIAPRWVTRPRWDRLNVLTGWWDPQ